MRQARVNQGEQTLSAVRASRHFAAVVMAAAAASACTPPAGPAGPGPERGPAPVAYVPLTAGFPAIPEVEAPLSIRVIHPTPGSPRPNVDSTFVYGSVGTGNAALTINGAQVPVAPNGAFIAYLPLPEDGTWRLDARKGGQGSSAQVSYRARVPADDAAPEPAAPGALPAGVWDAPRAARVTGGADTLATGSDAVYARPTPAGTYRWFFPRGARLEAVERRGSQVRVRLDTASAWINLSALEVGAAPGAAQAPAPLGTVSLARAPEPEAYDLTVGAAFAPFLVETEGSTVRLTVYGATLPQPLRPLSNEFVRGVTATQAGPGTVRMELTLASPAWGYKAFYGEGGRLVLRVRQPPRIDPANPLRGVRIVIDPGHPPAGATGPTGLYEGDANLAISLPLAELLRARGAEVTLTRTGREPVELAPRTELAVRTDAHLLVSVHNNAFGEGQNPFRAHHTSVYYFHPHAAGLARALNGAIAPVALIPNRGALVSNLALARPTWMPAVLTESLFMPIPEQEQALRTPEYVRRLAEAHAAGIEAFLRERAQ